MADELSKVREALDRIQGIADADGGTLLGEYGFRTIKDALFDARMALDALESARGPATAGESRDASAVSPMALGSSTDAAGPRGGGDG